MVSFSMGILSIILDILLSKHIEQPLNCTISNEYKIEISR
ncbi:hypothetical protein CYCME_0239 [Cycloclasticus zancles 78-ME]|uniref:Uncharacterized protein n=1 Tax=Cycloclasticus zancles 78-ME TaxID=1198232 RepID=S5T460_9GAMM|nr:hypothetical protein CYCME_0239 [Cycloclasticus zancles 78-ME]